MNGLCLVDIHAGYKGSLSKIYNEICLTKYKNTQFPGVRDRDICCFMFKYAFILNPMVLYLHSPGTQKDNTKN